MKMKLLLLTFGSVLLTGIVVASAFYQKKQFYPSIIYITKSSISMAAMYFQAFVFMVLVSKLLSKVFFGQLRPAEIEHLMERMWYAITETCLAFTVFREDFSPKFVAMFTILLFFKCFHWLAEDRVDFMERSPVIPVKFHVRMIGLITMLSTIDYMFILYAYRFTIERGPTAQLVFGFEYTILKLSLIVITCRYILHTIDSRRETPWDQKATFMLYIDLISNFLKLVFYVLFLVLMIRVHTLPLFIFRPVYLSMRAFKKTVQDLILSRKAIHYMNTVFKTATQEDLEASDNICIICREEMKPPNSSNGRARNIADDYQPSNIPKCLPCGHIFHCACLKTWFQRQQTCPTCRMDVLRNVNSSGNTQQQQQGRANQQSQNTPTTTNNTRQNRPGSTQPSLNNASPQGNVQMPPFPPNIFPFPMAPFPWMANPQSNEQTTNSNLANNGAPLPPFNPFMFPGMFTRPMPELSSADLAKLSDEELQKLEKQGREGMEFRVKTLQQIHTLLDAAVLLMNAYMISAQNAGIETTGSSANIGNTEKAKGDNKPEEKLDASSPVENEKENIVSDIDGNVEIDSKEEEEISKIRNRRLKKFQQQSSELSPEEMLETTETEDKDNAIEDNT